MALKYSKVNSICLQDWDDLVSETYGKPYSFQQQDGCQSRGCFPITIPSDADDFENDSIPEEVNGDEMGVSFKAWIERDPDQPLKDQTREWELKLFWDRNFYPDIQTVANDLFEKGLIEAGDYVIDIDW